MKSLSVCAIVLSLTWWSIDPASADKPINVLMIAVDDLRPELNCYGAEHIHSPNIDRLAAEGLRFDRAYCQVAVCGASRASLLSGCRPETTGCWDYLTPLRSKMPDVLTLPQHFKQNGYETGFLGKVYHSPGDDASSWTLRPRVWSPPRPGKGRSYVNDVHQQNQNAAGNRKPAGAGPRQAPSIENGGDVPDDIYVDGHNAVRAAEIIKKFAAHDRPFFFAVGFTKPHLPFNAPAKYWDLYDRDRIVVPSRQDCIDSVSYGRSNWEELKNYSDIPKSATTLDDAKSKELIHGYYAAVSYMDAQVGVVLDALDASGQRDNTIVVLWGDHGWYLGDFGDWCKHTNYEIATRVPLIISAPGFRSHQSTESLTEYVDLFPTLCELAGLTVPPHCQGKSVVDLLSDPASEIKQAAFSQYVRHKPGTGKMLGTSVRTQRFRYTQWRNEATGELDAVELIDFQTDPEARRNVAADPAYEAFLPGLDELCRHSGVGV